MFMKKFTKAVELMQNGTVLKQINTNLWEVEEPFIWFIDYQQKKWQITVQKWFETDFGSIPRIFWSLFNPTEWVSYILHDYLYSTKWIFYDESSWKFCAINRKQVDAILKEALQIEWCSKIKASIIYMAVRVGGWYNWNFGNIIF